MANQKQYERVQWGGLKLSGVGRENGAYGIGSFVETRAILEVTRCMRL
jgi:acyl-CoA reductase-like NAD-dependent aldehyde dehydrogenase